MGALAAGTVLSVVVTGPGRSWRTAAMGPAPAAAPAVHHPVASYLALAAAPTGNGLELFAVVAVIYALCLFCGGLAPCPREGDWRWPGVGAAICGGA